MNNIKTKELSKLGYTNDQSRSLVINIMSRHFKHHSKDEMVALLTEIKNNPAHYIDDDVVGRIAATFMDEPEDLTYNTFSLLEQTGRLKIYGGKEIEHSAKKQMELVMSLPVTVQGALMPDAHTGYGMPIGGVLAARNAVIPFAVGVDIGCRMALTIIGESESFFRSHAFEMKMALKEYTHFGMEGSLELKQEHPVLDDPAFGATEFLKRLQGKAERQLGTSGSGNHFVDFGIVELKEGNAIGQPAGKYVALLSHSGSRGLGANIAQHYTRIAMDVCRLPKEAKQLAWLDMNSEAGQEYWLSMNLAGDYAKACHDRIRINLLNALGLQAIATVENHHNFAWKEQLPDGTEVIVHRKGATPAHAGELGIIPGSMTTPAYIVSGKGVPEALNSASHGAGRAMSRQRAKENMTVSGMKQMLSSAGVALIGGSVEENPLAYKDIHRVMAMQESLVNIEGVFTPRIVRMNKD